MKWAWNRLSAALAFVLDWGIPPTLQPPPTKSIAIIGGGTGGLGALQVILEIQHQKNLNWEVVLYEQRRGLGGVWLEDLTPPSPPTLPESPLYPSLRTNTPHPSMTYLDFPFPPGVNLYPAHQHVHQYHLTFADHFNLHPYIHLRHNVTAATWVGDDTTGHWNLRIHREAPPSARILEQTTVFERSFDHLVVASGHFRYPNLPQWEGQDEWLANTPRGTPKREIIHSIFWRDPLKYKGRNLLVIGGGSSGRDVVVNVAPVAKTVFHSLSESKSGFPVTGAIVKPRISYFTRDAVHFVDGTSESSVDSLVVATGYQVRVPFLEDGGALVVDPKARSTNTSTIFPQPRTPLTTNLRYVRPLYKQILSLSTEFPPNALYFVSLPVNVSNAPSAQAQAQFVAHTLADPTLLPSRLELLSELEEWEELLRKHGYDPDRRGHATVDLVGNDESRSAYPDDVVDFLKARNVEGLPLRGSGARYTEDWRRRSGLTRNLGALRNIWARVESLGPEEVRKRLKGRRTEEDWANLLDELLHSVGAD